MTSPSNSICLVRRLSILDRLFPLWILVAMVAVGALRAAVPGIKDISNALSIGNGLLWMMYPVLAKVKYEELGIINRRQNSSDVVQSIRFRA